MAETYQIKFRGRVVGEASLYDLRNQVALRQIGALHKVSSDGVNWRYVSECPELLEDEASSPQQHSSPPAPIEEEIVAESGWFLLLYEEQVGPFSEDAITEYIEEGRISESDLLWYTGMESWTRADELFAVPASREEPRPSALTKLRQRITRTDVPAEMKELSLLSIASPVFGMLWVFGMGSLAALVLGVLGIYDILTSDGRRKGLPYALIGILFGLAGLPSGIYFVFWR